MNAVTIAHVSDLHLPFEPAPSTLQLSKRQLSLWSWKRRRAIHRSEILEALIADLRAHRVDHIAITGDTVNFSLPEEFRRAAEWLATLDTADRISLVPGNHDALVAVDGREGLDRWMAWTRAETGWPSVFHREGVTLIGLNSALPTAPLLARGELGAAQLSRLETILEQEASAGRLRVLLLHHPVAEHAVSWRKALADRTQLRAVLKRVGAELILHGHARDARLDTVAGPRGLIPCLCVPSSSAVPNPADEGARWHRLVLSKTGNHAQAEITVRRWSTTRQAFEEAGHYLLQLPRLQTQ